LQTWFRAQCLLALGYLAVEAGEVLRGEALIREVGQIYQTTGSKRGLTQVLIYLADTFLALGEPKKAARLLGPAGAARGQSGVVPEVGAARLVVQHVLGTLQARLAGPDFAAAWAEGRAMSLEEAWAYALA